MQYNRNSNKQVPLVKILTCICTQTNYSYRLTYTLLETQEKRDFFEVEIRIDALYFLAFSMNKSDAKD